MVISRIKHALKFTFALIFVFALFATAISCVTVKNDNGKSLVVAANFPSYDFARHVCGDAADVKMLLPAGSESHSYEPTARDIIDVQNCDLFIYTGAESDVWIDKILNSLDNRVNTLKMTDCVQLLPIGGHEHDDVEFDEHVWTSPVNALKIIDCIKDKMCITDEKNASVYTKNADKYKSEITVLDSEFRDFFSKITNKTMVFGDRFPLIYFTHEYGISYAAAFPGCADHSEPSAATIADIIKKIDSENISTVYYIEFSDKKIANTLAESTGAKTALFYTCHNVSKEQFDKGETYVSLMRENLETLKATMS